MMGMDVLRWLTIMALRGRTWAGDNILDSPASPADLIIGKERAPFIGVYTDDADIELDDNSLMTGLTKVYLLIEVAIGESPPAAVDLTDNSPDVPAGSRLGRTDDAMEANIGFIAWQALQALTSTGSPWAELWREFVPVRTSISIRRGGYGQNEREQPAVRYASRIIRLTCEVLNGPVRGEAIDADSFWGKFLVAADGDSDLSPLAGNIRANLETDAPVPSWRVAQRVMTLTGQALTAIGIAPPDATQAPETGVQVDEEEPPTMTRVKFHKEPPGEADLVVDEGDDG